MMNTVDDKSKNAIFSAIEAGDLSAVQLLLAQDNGIVFHEYKDNRVAIHFAVKQFKSEIVNFLLELGPEKVIRFDSCNLFSVLVWSWVDLNEDHDESEMLATFDVLMKFSTELNHPAYLLLQPASLEFFSNLEVQTETPSPDDPLFNRSLARECGMKRLSTLLQSGQQLDVWRNC